MKCKTTMNATTVETGVKKTTSLNPSSKEILNKSRTPLSKAPSTSLNRLSKAPSTSPNRLSKTQGTSPTSNLSQTQSRSRYRLSISTIENPTTYTSGNSEESSELNDPSIQNLEDSDYNLFNNKRDRKEKLRQIFLHYCHIGGSCDSSIEESSIDNVNFIKFCRDCPGLISSINFTITDADLIFARSKRLGERRLKFKQFLHALSSIAAIKYPNSEVRRSIEILLQTHVFQVDCLRHPTNELNVIVSTEWMKPIQVAKDKVEEMCRVVQKYNLSVVQSSSDETKTIQ